MNLTEQAVLKSIAGNLRGAANSTNGGEEAVTIIRKMRVAMNNAANTIDHLTDLPINNETLPELNDKSLKL